MRLHRPLQIFGFFPVIAATFVLLAAGQPRAFAQLNSSAQTVTLNATLAEALTISATPSGINFNLVQGGIATASAPVAVSTSWLLKSTRANIAVFAWFTTPSAALSDGASTPNNIPSTEILGQVSSGTPTSYTAFTQSTALGTASGSLQLFTQALSASSRALTRTDNLNLQINLTAQPQLPAGTYSGILNLQAQAL